jgi:hypothetical protein
MAFSMSVLALPQSNDAAWTDPNINANDAIRATRKACMNGKTCMLDISL